MIPKLWLLVAPVAVALANAYVYWEQLILLDPVVLLANLQDGILDTFAEVWSNLKTALELGRG